MQPAYSIEKITGDNRRPGMEHNEGYLVRYNPHDSFGWLSCRTFATLRDAEAFAGAILAEPDHTRKD